MHLIGLLRLKYSKANLSNTILSPAKKDIDLFPNNALQLILAYEAWGARVKA